MKSFESLSDILKNFPAHESFVKSLFDAANQIYSIVNDYTAEEKINIISHLADADGFGSQIILHKGLERILGFTGNLTKTVQSERIMSFSKEKESLSSLDFLHNNLGDGRYIITDLATLDPADAKRLLNDLIVFDHHKPKKFDECFTVLNPHMHGIDGGKELSASMISTLALNLVYEMVEEDIVKDFEGGVYSDREQKKTVKKNLNLLRDELDFLSMFGIAGSRADMQDDSGLNRAIYDYFEKRGILEKAETSFYGLTTKDSAKVWAQTNPMFNLKYRICDLSRLNKGFTGFFPRLAQQREDLIVEIYNDFRWAFSMNNGKFGINTHYLQDLPDEKLAELNGLVKKLTGSNVVEIKGADDNREVELCEPFCDIGFEGKDDDEKIMKNRISAARQIISSELGGDPEVPLYYQPALQLKMSEMFRDSFIAFADRDDLKYQLGQLDSVQYIPRNLNKHFVNLSIPEIANLMTSISKLEYGETFILATDEILNGRPGKNVDEVYRIHADYKRFIFHGMSNLEGRVLAREGLVSMSDDIHFMMLDELKKRLEETEDCGDVAKKIDMRKMTGVFGGLACNTRLIPGGKGIFFTGVTYSASNGGRNTDMVKISGRATDSLKYASIDLGEFMQDFDGGGHKSAAACNIPASSLDNFLEKVRNYDFYGGGD